MSERDAADWAAMGRVLLHFQLPTVAFLLFLFYFIRGFIGAAVVDGRLKDWAITEIIPIQMMLVFWEVTVLVIVGFTTMCALAAALRGLLSVPQALGAWTQIAQAWVKKSYLRWKYRPHKDKPLDINDGPFRSTKEKEATRE